MKLNTLAHFSSNIFSIVTLDIDQVYERCILILDLSLQKKKAESSENMETKSK